MSDSNTTGSVPGNEAGGVNVLIVDDHPLFRDALSAAVTGVGRDDVRLLTAGSLAEAASVAETEAPDRVMLDLELSDGSGFEGLSQFAARSPGVPVYIVSATESPQAFSKARTLGARGYLPKTLPPEELAAALVTVLDGGEWFPPSTDDASSTDEGAERIASLTPAQRRVLDGLADGLLNKQIAYNMGISEATVKAHMTAILRKLGASNRTQALLYYRETVSAGGGAS